MSWRDAWHDDCTTSWDSLLIETMMTTTTMTLMWSWMLDVGRKCYWNWQLQRHCCFYEISVCYDGAEDVASHGSAMYAWEDRGADAVSLSSYAAAAVTSMQLRLRVELKLLLCCY